MALVMLVAVASCTGRPAAGEDLVTGGSAAPTTGPIASGTGLIPPDGDAGDGATPTGTAAAVAAADGPPAAVLLPWLDGAMPEPGVVIGPAGQRQWVGRAAGETATLGDGWYRYFGPDGSLVGCASGGACVGVARDGTIAVTAAPHGAREAYTADGDYLGSFADDGARLADVSDPESLAAALARSGVDLSGLVDAAGRVAPFAGGVTGDPHVVTMGGERYGTQLGGQFIARAGDAKHRVQLQFSAMPHRADVSVVTAAAIDTGDETVVVDSDGALTVAGHVRARETDFGQLRLAGGVAVGVWPVDGAGPMDVTVVWPDGGTVAVTARGPLGLTVVAHLPHVDGATGLFGSASVLQAPDLTARTGVAAAAAGGVDQAVASWQVPESSALLPSLTPVTGLGGKAPVLDPGARKVAQRLCTGRGMDDAADIDACAFDIAVTGDTGFIAGHLALGLAAESTGVPAAFARRWPASTTAGATTSTALPSSHTIAVTLAPGAARLYRVGVTHGGPVTLATGARCSDDALTASNRPAMDQPAWRIFDPSGRAVSDRLPLCGTATSGDIPAGDYLLAVANGPGQPALALKADVQAP